ncbi:MAG: ammonia-forming cytochrome c nitrite reductase subunit c552 [Truepera sp.]|nr:ammonia-forming cytochrome c nitrite reductase subunit c552 [Truepera sp.]
MTRRLKILLMVVLLVFIAAGVGVGLLLTNIQQRIAEGERLRLQARIVPIGELEVDPAVWGINFPHQYDSWLRTREYGVRTPHAGSEPFDKLEANPFRRMAWAGFPFELEFNEDRGHYFAQTDQRETHRIAERVQPGACLNCHSGEFTVLLSEMSWDELNRTPYNHFRDRLAERSLGIACADCHDPNTMELRISRPALENALVQRGIDWRQASRQEMRSLVCAQCHVEYYFLGAGNTVVFPWSQGLTVEAAEQHYDAYGFADFTHTLTQAPMIKVQHPEYELFSTSVHYAAGVACADCHMPFTRVGGVKISDHWIRSPLTNINSSCLTCHAGVSEAEMLRRVVTIQDRTKNLLGIAEGALTDAINAIVAAMEAGVPDAALAEARQLHRASQLRWDWIDAENSKGFHSPQEAARVLAHATDLGRQAQLSAMEALTAHREARAGE